MPLIGHRHETGQAYNRGLVQAEALRADQAPTARHQFDLLTQNETDRSPDAHHGERLIGHVENKHSNHGEKLAARPTLILGLAPSQPQHQIIHPGPVLGIAVLGYRPEAQQGRIGKGKKWPVAPPPIGNEATGLPQGGAPEAAPLWIRQK